jgi:uncharacterized protein (TIRG00374 family)
MRWPSKKHFVVLLALALLGFLLYRFRSSITLEGFDWARLGAAVAQARLDLLALSLVAIYVAYALRALRWTRLSRYLERADFPNIFSSTLMGFTAIFLLGRAGEPIRPLLIARKDRVPVSSAFGIYVLERVLDMTSTGVIIALALLAAPGLLAQSESNPLLKVARTGGIILMLTLAAGIVFLFYFRFHGAGVVQRRVDSWRAKNLLHGWRGRMAGLFAGFSQGLHSIRTWGDLAAAVGYSAVHWLVIAVLYYWVAQAFGGRLGELTLTDALLVLAFTMVGSAVQLPAVGGGSQAASFLAYRVIFGVEQEAAAAAAIVLWLITFAGAMLAGVPLLLREGLSVGQLRHLAKEEAAAEAHGGHVERLPAAEDSKS